MEYTDSRWPTSLKLKAQFENTLEEICIQFESDQQDIKKIIKALTDLQKAIDNYEKNEEYINQKKILEHFIKRFQENPTSAVYKVFTGFLKEEFFDSIFPVRSDSK